MRQVAFPFKPDESEPAENGALYLWHVSLTGWRGHARQLASILSEPEQERSDRIVRPNGKPDAILSLGLLRLTLASHLGKSPSELEIERRGKPKLFDESLSFNVSHSGDRMLIAVTRQAAVGTDIERHDPARDVAGLARRYFRPNEAALIGAVDAANAQQDFLTLWTTKEAVLKADGGGIRLGLENADAAGALGVAGWTPVHLDGTAYQTNRIAVEAGYVAAVAVRADAPPETHQREAVPANDFGDRIAALIRRRQQI